MKMVICGDLSVTATSKPIFDKSDAKGAFCDVLDLFEGADKVVINLECALTDGENRIAKIGPNLKGPKSTADALRAAGVTHCAISNNHIFDYGKEGFYDTLRELDRVGIEYTGWGENYEDSRKNLVIEHDGVSVSIVNVCEHEYTYATENRVGARPFDEFETMQDIRIAKGEADHVVVIYHGGKEFCRYPSPRLVKACREMIRCGADVVLCQHSHIIGVYEEFEGGKIMYGQGNFHFPNHYDTESWNEGLIAVLNIGKEKIDLSFIPIKAERGYIRLANESESAYMMASFDERSRDMTSGEWKNKWHEFCTDPDREYYRNALGYTKDSTPAQYQRFAHYLDCEAHLDVIRELFPTYNATNETE